MLGKLFGMCMVFNIQWARLAFSKYLLFLSKVREKLWRGLKGLADDWKKALLLP